MSIRKTITKKTPFCPHCRNLGLANDHFLRKTSDPNSPITCPVLLNNTCKYCHEKGHTLSKCDKRFGNQQQRKTSATKPVIVEKKVSSNRFAVLDEKPVVLVEKPDLFPPLGGKIVIKKPCNNNLYLEIAKKTPVVFNAVKEQELCQEPQPMRIKYLGLIMKKSWDDDEFWGSSDEEQEE